MRRPPVTEGSTLIVVVLFTLLLLAGLLAASMRLGLSSRRAVAESSQSLMAQYAAESAVTRAAVRVGEIQSLLTWSRLSAPSTLKSADLTTYAQQYCGNAAWVPGVSSTNGASVVTCTVSPATANQFQVFNALVSGTAYASVLPSSEASGAGTPQWWKGQIGTTIAVAGDDMAFRYRLEPLRVEREGLSTFRFYLRLVSVAARGTRSGATRVLAAQGVQNGVWYIKVFQPSFTNDVLFTNFHRSRGTTAAVPNVNFTTQNFNGPVHTNEKFLFTSGSTATFGGQVTSAGCTNLNTLPQGSSACAQSPGVYVAGTQLLPAAGLTGDALNTNLRQQIDNQTDVTWSSEAPKFDVPYQPMPTTASDIKADAIAGGLYLPAALSPNAIVLKAGDANGTSPSSYNTTTQKWTPAPTHQYITVTPATGAAVEYRYASDRTLQQRVSGSWITVKTGFNGVLFSENAIGWKDANGRKFGGMSGPGRDGSGRALPALAPFAQMTVAGQKDMNISGDLTMSDTPLTCTAGTAGFDQCADDASQRDNVLGLYVQGDLQATPPYAADISVTWDAPDNLTLHAMAMSSTGEMNVQYHDQKKNNAARGVINLTGGLVENWYGAFGTVSGNTPSTGYGRNFNYDWRFQVKPGFGPPSYKVSPVWRFEDPLTDSDKTLVTPTTKRAPLSTTIWRQGAAEDF